MTRVTSIYLILYSALWIGMFYLNVPNIFSFIEVGLGIVFSITFTLLIRQIQRYYHSKNPLNFINLSIVLICSLIGGSLIFIIERNLVDLNFASSQGLMFFLFRTLIMALLLTIGLLLLWIDKQKSEDDRNRRSLIARQKEFTAYELRSLEKQWQPHFLFNSLNSINALIQIDPQQAQKMIHLLSDYMRNSIRIDQNEITPLASEIEHLKRYADIEKIRFGDRLHVQFNIAENTEQCTIPKLALQPLMENAIKYSLYDNLGAVDILLETEIKDHLLIIRITNPFDPETRNASKGTGFGLQSIRKKLYLLYKRDNLLKTTTENNNTFIAEMHIPQ